MFDISPQIDPQSPVATERPARAGQSARVSITSALAGIAVLGGGLLPWPVPGLLLSVSGLTVLVTLIGLWQVRRFRHRMSQDQIRALRMLLAEDPDPVWISTPPESPPRALTAAAHAGGAALEQMLATWTARPAVLLASLREAALRGQAARRVLQRPDGTRLISAQRIGDPPLVIWRLVALGGQEAQMRDTNALGFPLVTLGAPGQVPLANAAARQMGLGRDLQASDFAALETGPEVATLSLPLPDGPQRFLALGSTGQDGQRDVLLLPPHLAPAQDHNAVEDIPVALVQINLEGRVSQSNHAARLLIGLDPGEPAFLADLVEGLGRPVSDWLNDARAGIALNRPEVLRVTRAHHDRYVQITLRRAPGLAPRAGLVAVLIDATELKSLEARFVQSQKMQAIGQLAGGVAHDFNNLLTAISGHCDLLLLRRTPADPDYADLMQVHHNTNRAAALVRQLLAFSRKQTLRPEAVALDGLLEDLGTLLNRLVGDRITLTLAHGRDMPPIRADRRQLEQVILNLVVNARDAMPMGGEIRIETRQHRIDSDVLRGRARLPAGDYVMIEVRDDGVGIPPEIIEKIFEPFFTTKRAGEGTGLGLSTAYGIVKQMGGWIFVESTEGAGSVFTLYFPQAPAQGRTGQLAGSADPPVAAPGAVGPDPALAGRGLDALPDAWSPQRAPADPSGAGSGSDDETGTMRSGVVLLVEDEAPVRAFAARALRMQGRSVIEAEDGEAALQILGDRALQVALFVTDVAMPGLDGPGWVAQARVARPDVPVLFISGYAEDGMADALRRLPESRFLAKPFSLRELGETVRQCLRLPVDRI